MTLELTSVENAIRFSCVYLDGSDCIGQGLSFSPPYRGTITAVFILCLIWTGSPRLLSLYHVL